MASISSFPAFAWSRRDPFRRYALARLGSAAAADQALDAALTRLREAWPVALRGGNVSADAWGVVRECVARLRPRAAEPAQDLVLHDLLSAEVADAVLLHYALGMQLREVAELMGTEPATVAAHLLRAERSLPAAVIHRASARSAR